MSYRTVGQLTFTLVVETTKALPGTCFFFCLPRFTAVSRTVFLIFMAGGIGSVQLSSDVNLPERVWEVGGKS